MFSGTTGLPQHSNPTPRCANYLCRPKTRYRLKTVVAVFNKYHAANVLNHILDKLVDNWDNDSKNTNQLPPAEFHPLSLNIVLPLRTVLDREDREFPRLVREAIHIRKLSPELNRDQGLELPTLYNALIRPKGQHRSTVRANSASSS